MKNLNLSLLLLISAAICSNSLLGMARIQELAKRTANTARTTYHAKQITRFERKAVDAHKKADSKLYEAEECEKLSKYHAYKKASEVVPTDLAKRYESYRDWQHINLIWFGLVPGAIIGGHLIAMHDISDTINNALKEPKDQR